MNASTVDLCPPRVSVLMTVYNAAAFLQESMDSILAQSFANWELIVVENGSVDGSAEILSRYRGDARIQAIFLSSNIGRTAALRQAFGRARGEYIAVLDADDVSEPERFHRQVAYLDCHDDVVLVGTWAHYIDENGVTIGESTPPADRESLRAELGSSNPIIHSSVMYRSAVAAEVGGYPADTPYAQDYALWLKLAARGDPAVLTERLCKFRIQPKSLTQAGQHQVLVARDLLEVMLKAGRQLRLDSHGRRRNRQEVAIARVRYANALAKRGRLVSALGTLLVAVVRDPASLVANRITREFYLRFLSRVSGWRRL